MITDQRIDEIFERQYAEYGQVWDQLDMRMFARAVIAEAALEPIDMVLHCPKCRAQHVDAPEGPLVVDGRAVTPALWHNPSHRSHLCHTCGHIWRPADVPTNGVAAVKTRGKNDSEPPTEAEMRAWS